LLSTTRLSGQETHYSENDKNRDHPKRQSKRQSPREEPHYVVSPHVVTRLRAVLTVQHEVECWAEADHVMETSDWAKEEESGGNESGCQKDTADYLPRRVFHLELKRKTDRVWLAGALPARIKLVLKRLFAFRACPHGGQFNVTAQWRAATGDLLQIAAPSARPPKPHGHMSSSLNLAMYLIGHDCVCAGDLLNQNKQLLSPLVVVFQIRIRTIKVSNPSRKKPNRIAAIAGRNQCDTPNSHSCLQTLGTLHPLQHLLNSLVRAVLGIIPRAEYKTYRQTNRQADDRANHCFHAR
jgi:hypothetical protein